MKYIDIDNKAYMFWNVEAYNVHHQTNTVCIITQYGS